MFPLGYATGCCSTVPDVVLDYECAYFSLNCFISILNFGPSFVDPLANPGSAAARPLAVLSLSVGPVDFQAVVQLNARNTIFRAEIDVKIDSVATRS